MISNTENTNQIIFLFPEDPTRSFIYTYQTETTTYNPQKLEDIFNAISKEKQHYFEFADTFGRKLPKERTIEEFSALQPFYITKMIPKLITIHIKLPPDDKVITLDI